jgi:hypothetical protein
LRVAGRQGCLRSRPTFEGLRHPAARGFIKLQRNNTMVAFVSSFVTLRKECDMIKLPPWDTPPWRLARELRPHYAAVNRVHELEATPNASPEEIASAQRAASDAASELTRIVDAMQLFEAGRTTVRYFGRG